MAYQNQYPVIFMTLKDMKAMKIVKQGQNKSLIKIILIIVRSKNTDMQ